MLNLAAASALRGESITADELLSAGLDGLRASLRELERYEPASVREAVLEAYDAEVANLRLNGDSMGYTLLALVAGLIAYWRASSFERTLPRIVEAGGDTDTNGAVAGALLGARFGLEAIPRRWRDRIADIRAGRTPMEALADRLLLSVQAPAILVGKRPGGTLSNAAKEDVENPHPEPNYAEEYSEDSLWEKIAAFALRAGREIIERVLVLYYCFQDRDTPAWAKTIIMGALGYFIAPLDAIPDLMAGVGFSDDLGALAVAFAAVAMHIKPEHKRQAEEKIKTWFS